MYKQIFTLLCALLLLGAVGCQKMPETQADRDDEVRAAVFKYMFEQFTPELQADVEVYFLALGSRTDPRSELLERFKGHLPPVKKVSASSRLGTGGVRDRVTGAKGVIFNIGEVKWISDKEVIVTGGYYQGGEGAAGGQYHVTFEDREWVVEEAEMQWIS
jgi:hypothetical protein